MEAERWQEIKSLFDAALELEAKKREQFLEQASAGDAELRREVEKLLESLESAASFMEVPAAGEVASLFAEEKTPAEHRLVTESENEKLVAGTVLAGRYRILGLLGKGGMGEVYKAEDLKLAQTVALKFLPGKLQRDKSALERFHAEVRMARQVAHGNVCRVFDIGEIEGRHFLSMEYVDGDDLSSLLRRIGRLPSDKAVEISRQLCAGLHAIHESGILHRDFKPANVIIDGKGRARITDFGIAGFAEEITTDELRVGTPAYMSPEQITGQGVSERSDIYALGLVLYEIFTGKQAFSAGSIPELIRKHQRETPTNPSEFVKDLDPLVEKVIFQCLEKNPQARPASALRVALVLPGGNPLQVALEAGETPSPEMVAAAPKKGALRPGVAVLLLAAVFVFIGLAMLMSREVSLHRYVPLEKSPEILRERSREMAEKFGYLSFDSDYGFTRETDYLEYLRDHDRSAERWQKLSRGQPAVVQFWYRQSPLPLAPLSGGIVEFNDPPNEFSEMVRMRVDTKGRLVYFDGVPPQIDDASQATREFDWANVFREAGLNLADFQPAESKWTPPKAFDERRAWTGKYAEQPDIEIRVEAAAYRGRLVSFQIVEPWSKPEWQTNASDVFSLDGSDIVLFSIFFGIMLLSSWLAVRNVRAGRSDLKGAFRITIFLFVLNMVRCIFSAHHVASSAEVFLIIGWLQSSLFWSCFAGLIYLAFEPFLRRHTPERLISWSRLLAGDWRDPLVGRDVLIGISLGAVTVALAELRHHLPIWTGELPPIPWIISNPNGAMLLGLRGFPVLFLSQIGASIVQGFMVVFLILFFTMLFRRRWLGTGAAWLMIFAFAVSGDLAAGRSPSSMILSIVFPTALILAASRFGVLAVMSTFVTFHLLIFYPITTELSAWYAADFVLCVIFLAALAIFAFYQSLAGEPVFQGKLLADNE